MNKIGHHVLTDILHYMLKAGTFQLWQHQWNRNQIARPVRHNVTV